MLLHELSTEVLTCIAGHLETKQLGHFSLACHKFLLIAHSESLWREKLYNDFGISYKLPDEKWKALYEKKCDDPTNNRLCPHIGHVTPHILKPYAVKYQQVLNWLPKNLNCTICSVNCARTGLCLYVWKGNTRNRCRDCAYTYHKDVQGHGILLRMNVLQMFCFDCNRQVGETRGDPSEAYHVNRLLEYLTQGSELGREAMERKHQCIKERLLYLQYADRACVLDDFYYIVDRLWTTSWFLRLCDGKIGQGAMTNDQLKDPETGRLNPLARPRGSFKGGFSIVTPALWDYLVETYGLIGDVYTSDDITGPEYADLRLAIQDWRLN